MVLEEKNIKDFIEDPNVKSFLVDAAGVLYNIDGIIPGASEAIQAIQKSKKEIFIVSNNSTKSICEIHNQFKSIGIFIEKDHILSSGLGLLHDKKTLKLIRKKRCFWVGWENSVSYLEGTEAIVTDQLNDAEVIVLLSSFIKGNHKVFAPIIEILKKNKEIKVICTNPDEFVYSQKGLLNVIGHYAKNIEKECGIEAHWIGKPYKNYSLMIKELISQKSNTKLSDNAVFFDDNIENVRAMIKDINITGCLIKETGLHKNKPLPEYISNEKLNKKMHYFTDSFSL